MGLWNRGGNAVALTQREFYGISGAEDLIPSRVGGATGRTVGNITVTDTMANRHSVVWACTRLNAGLMSSFPIDQYRDVPIDGQKIQVEMSGKLPIFTDPGGAKLTTRQWIAGTEADLIQSGNTVGLITERTAARNADFPEGIPGRIESQFIGECTYLKPTGKPPRWRIGNKEYDPKDVYHERRNVVSGLPVGLSTNLFAAWSIGEGLAMQKFGTDWFVGGGIPKAHMRNTAKRLKPEEIATTKQWYRDMVENGDLLVTGLDWEYSMVQAQTAGTEFIQGREVSDVAVCRFYETPGDLVDVNNKGSSITYANITQRLLEYLITRLGPKVGEREDALSRLSPTPRYIKMNTDALLRMDPQTRSEVMRNNIEARILTNAEARGLDNRKPLDEDQKREFIEIYGDPKSKASASGSQTGGQNGNGSGSQGGSGGQAQGGK